MQILMKKHVHKTIIKPEDCKKQWSTTIFFEIYGLINSKSYNRL